MDGSMGCRASYSEFTDSGVLGLHGRVSDSCGLCESLLRCCCRIDVGFLRF